MPLSTNQIISASNLKRKLLESITDKQSLQDVMGVHLGDSLHEATRTLLLPERQTDLIALVVEFCAHQTISLGYHQNSY